MVDLNQKKIPSVDIEKVNEKFDRIFDSTTGFSSNYMDYKKKRAYKEELYKRYGSNLDKKTELEKELKRLKELENTSRRISDYRGVDEYRDKIKLINSLLQ